MVCFFRSQSRFQHTSRPINADFLTDPFAPLQTFHPSSRSHILVRRVYILVQHFPSPPEPQVTTPQALRPSESAESAHNAWVPVLRTGVYYRGVRQLERSRSSAPAGAAQSRARRLERGTNWGHVQLVAGMVAGCNRRAQRAPGKFWAVFVCCSVVTYRFSKPVVGAPHQIFRVRSENPFVGRLVAKEPTDATMR